MIDFEWYRSFVAVYQAETVSAAAVRRNMTQPGISQHLAALERNLDCSLFERTPRKMVPTTEGKRLYAQVIGSVEQLECLSTPLALRGEKQKISLKIGTAREYFYAVALPQITHLDPSRYELQILLGQTDALIRQLEAGEIDTVIASQRINPRSVHYVPLELEEFVLVAPSSMKMPELRDHQQTAAWLETQTWIAYAPDLPIIRRYWQDIFERRPNLSPNLIMPDLLLIVRAIALGLGISILPKYLCQEALAAGQIAILWQPPQRSENQIYIAFMRERASQTEIKWIVDALRAPLE